MMQKGIITFTPTYLTKITYISSILKFKFLNNESLVVQVSYPDLTSKVYTSEPNGSSSNEASYINFKTMNVCIIFNSKVF